MYRIVFFMMALSSLALLQSSCQSSSSVATTTPSPAPTATATPLPIKYEDIVVGDGPRAVWGANITLKYVGKLEDGKVFEESKMDYKLGDKTILKGFNIGVGGGEGISAMKVGGKRKITLPPELAYGSEGDGQKVPPNATITFEIELLKMQGGLGF